MRAWAIALLAVPRLAMADGAFLAAEVAGEGIARSGPADARSGQRVVVYLVVPRGAGRYLTSAPRLVVRGRAVPERSLVRPDTATSGSVRWSRIEPRMFRTLPESEQADRIRPYSNAVLFGPHHGRFRGLDPIEYFETNAPGASGFSFALENARPTDARFDIHGGMGVMRVRARATVGGAAVATPGLERVGPTGIADDVLRVTFRAGDDLGGWLTSFHNVPNVFGSAGRGTSHQTARYVGTDCADVLLGALRRATGRPFEFTSVAGLSRLTDTVLDARIDERRTTDLEGTPIDVRFGSRVKEGDVVLIDYGTPAIPRPWAHVGLLWKDRSPRSERPDGRLGPEDLLAHTAFLHGLAVQKLGTQAPARIRVVRWNGSVRRALADSGS